jgi:macrodomain Ter protein organizer (MatP/YcbG family)
MKEENLNYQAWKKLVKLSRKLGKEFRLTTDQLLNAIMELIYADKSNY